MHESEAYASATSVFVGVGFCERLRLAKQQQRQQLAFVPKRGEWSKTGTTEEHLVDIRTDGFQMNDNNLPYASMPIVYYYDKYNATDMTNKV